MFVLTLRRNASQETTTICSTMPRSMLPSGPRPRPRPGHRAHPGRRLAANQLPRAARRRRERPRQPPSPSPAAAPSASRNLRRPRPANHPPLPGSQTRNGVVVDARPWPKPRTWSGIRTRMTKRCSTVLPNGSTSAARTRRPVPALQEQETAAAGGGRANLVAAAAEAGPAVEATAVSGAGRCGKRRPTRRRKVAIMVKTASSRQGVWDFLFLFLIFFCFNFYGGYSTIVHRVWDLFLPGKCIKVFFFPLFFLFLRFLSII